jgi:hypothetical protein
MRETLPNYPSSLSLSLSIPPSLSLPLSLHCSLPCDSDHRVFGQWLPQSSFIDEVDHLKEVEEEIEKEMEKR